ncbi:MAG: 3-methyladenine DNA glycosylase [Dermatophilaceae bacterium]|nr:3-methyladenine DNA glycosylase [Intrasporangiaceae bacterium]
MRLSRPLWQEYASAHQARADALTAAHRERRVQGRAHPVADFLFTYYNNSPGRLRRWHPGAGVVLAEAADAPHTRWRHYRMNEDGSVELDLDSFVSQRGRTVTFVRELLTATLARPAHTACFGLHEWAMVYRLEQEQIRHDRWPLRLGEDGTDEVVRAQTIRCSHFDAFRFFAPDAVPRNALQPTRESQVDLEQPGCLHAGMDVYKWAYKLAPATPGDLMLDAFEVAAEIRVIDMRASPYDLTALGLEPIPIETRPGRAEYAEAQRGFTRRSNDLRRRLVEVCDTLLDATA